MLRSGRHQRCALLVGECLRLGRYDARHAEYGRNQCVVIGVDARERQGVDALLQIRAEYLPVDRAHTLDRRRFDRDVEVDLASLQGALDHRTDVEFELAVCRRHAHRKIELFGVERTYFDRYLLCRQRRFPPAESGHRFYHSADLFLTNCKYTQNYRNRCIDRVESRVRQLTIRRRDGCKCYGLLAVINILRKFFFFD